MRKRVIPVLIAVLALIGTTFLWFTAPVEVSAPENISASTPNPTSISANTPKTLALANSPLQKNILAAGDYLVRQQLANGELAYQVNLLTNDRSSTPSSLRLMGGVSTLYTVCRVSNDSTYCRSADRALEHYLPNLLTDSQRFKGTCLYANGACPLGGATITIDAIYKRWQASGSVLLNDHDLLADAVNLGYFIASMRRPEGGFYHSFDPHFTGTVDPNYIAPTFNGEAISAFLQLYEMTGNRFWLEQARTANDVLLTQTVTEDYAHAYALALFARLDELTRADQTYARQIADLIIAGQVRSLNPVNSSASTATKIEALSSIAQAFVMSDIEPDGLEREIQIFITFVQARQLPANDCNFDLNASNTAAYNGGLFNTCEDPSIRVDGVQHWVNGLTLYLEFLGME